MKAFLTCAALLLFSLPARADFPPDRPGDGESFSVFFRRITRYGAVPGVPLEAPPEFQASFLKWLPTGQWVGAIDRAEKKLKDRGADLWMDWYKRPAPAPLLFPDEGTEEKFAGAYSAEPCPHACRPFPALATLPWTAWTTDERAAFAHAYVFAAPIFGGRTISQHLAELYGANNDATLARLTARILDHAEFLAAVKALGWGGDVYFRGITAPDPQNARRRLILLDGDLMRTQTEFTIPLFQMLEYVGILTHELSHVFQDFDAEADGISLSIGSTEGLFLIEGQAEDMAERALTKAAAAMADASALELYVPEQGLGIMAKDSAENPQFMAYRVGLAFQRALFAGAPAPSPADLRRSIYGVISGQNSLGELVRRSVTR